MPWYQISSTHSQPPLKRTRAAILSVAPPKQDVRFGSLADVSAAIELVRI